MYEFRGRNDRSDLKPFVEDMKLKLSIFKAYVGFGQVRMKVGVHSWWEEMTSTSTEEWERSRRF